MQPIVAPFRQSPRSMRQGFSLLELLLVVFIVSLVYFLGFEGFEKKEEKEQVLTPLHLKEAILKDTKIQNRGTLLCVDSCQTCYFRVDAASSFERIKTTVSLGKSKIYIMNRRDEFYTPEYGRYLDHDICLLADFYSNGSSTPFVLQNKDGIFFLPSSLKKAQKVDTLEKARSLWLSYANDLKDRGSYY